MKTNIQKVYSKLPLKKHYFRNHKIDLGLVQDLEDRVFDIVPKYEELVELSDKRLEAGLVYSRLKEQEEKLAYSLESEGEEIERQLDKAKEKAIELGIELDTDFIDKQLKGLKSAIMANTAF